MPCEVRERRSCPLPVVVSGEGSQGRSCKERKFRKRKEEQHSRGQGGQEPQRASGRRRHNLCSSFFEGRVTAGDGQERRKGNGCSGGWDTAWRSTGGRLGGRQAQGETQRSWISWPVALWPALGGMEMSSVSVRFRHAHGHPRATPPPTARDIFDFLKGTQRS